MGPYKSKQFYFKTEPKLNDVLNIIFYGDMGAFRADSLEFIIDDVQTKKYNFIFHMGDLAYDLKVLGIVGNLFLSKIQTISSMIPYMTIPGITKAITILVNILIVNMPEYSTSSFLYTKFSSTKND